MYGGDDMFDNGFPHTYGETVNRVNAIIPSKTYRNVSTLVSDNCVDYFSKGMTITNPPNNTKKFVFGRVGVP
jgi:hypothetical protein